MQTWKDIWNRKTLQLGEGKEDEFTRFCQLKKANGFDVAVSDEQEYYQYFYDNFLRLYETLLSITNNDIQSVFEVGCGSGVNLMMFGNRGIRELGGIDYSQSLVDVCRKFSGGGVFCGEADTVDTHKKYDVVMSDGVFQYFSSVDYAETVLNKMLTKASKVVMLGGVHDPDRKEEWLAYRKSLFDDYDARYEGLDKLFLSKEWIKTIAAKFGKHVTFKENGSDVYWNSRYSYDAYLYADTK